MHVGRDLGPAQVPPALLGGDVRLAEAQLDDGAQRFIEWMASKAECGTSDEHGMPSVASKRPRRTIPFMAPGAADYTHLPGRRKEQCGGRLLLFSVPVPLPVP